MGDGAGLRRAFKGRTSRSWVGHRLASLQPEDEAMPGRRCRQAAKTRQQCARDLKTGKFVEGGFVLTARQAAGFPGRTRTRC